MKAALESKLYDVQHASRIQILVDNIVPVLRDLDASAADEDRLAQAVEANVRWSMRQLQDSLEGCRALEEGRAKLAGAVYEIASGYVRFLADSATFQLEPAKTVQAALGLLPETRHLFVGAIRL